MSDWLNDLIVKFYDFSVEAMDWFERKLKEVGSMIR